MSSSFSGRRLMYRPFGCERQETYGLRSASSTRFVCFALRQPLAAVDARLHPVELGEDRVGQVEPAVREDVALGAAQDAERRERLVRVGDLERLAAQVVRGQAAHGADRRACGRRSRGTRSRARSRRSAIASTLALPSDQVVWQCRSPRICRELDERRRLAAERRLAKLGRAERDPERAVDALLVGRVRQRLERGDVLGRAGRADELGAEPCRLGDHELDRDALDGDAVARGARHARAPRRSPAATRTRRAPAPASSAATTTANRSLESR